jgi:hypothetical protein
VKRKSKAAIISTAMCFVLAVTACLTLSSCGSDNDGTSGSNEDGPSDKTIEEIVSEVPDAKDEIEKQAEASDMTVSFDGDTVIYTYKYEETFSAESVAIMAPALKKAMDEKKNEFVSLANTISRRTTREDVVVRIRFTDAADTEIYSVDFAEDPSAENADSSSTGGTTDSGSTDGTADTSNSGTQG